MCPIEGYLKSLDVDYQESADMISRAFDFLSISLYEEEGNTTGSSFMDKVQTAINNLIEKIKKIFNDAKDAITNFFSKNDVEKKCKEVEEEAKKDPKKKKSYKSRKEAIDLSKVTLEDIYKARDFNEIESIMNKYRSQRNKAIAVGTVVTLAITGVAAFVIKRQHDLNTTLKKEKDKTENKLTELKKKNSSLRDAINKKNKTIDSLKSDVKDMKSELDAKSKAQIAKVRVTRKIRQASNVTEDINTEIKSQEAKASAIAEVSSNLCKDVVSEIKDMTSSLLNSNASVSKKAIGAVSSVSAVKDMVKNSPKTIGDQSLENLTEKFNKVKEAGTKQEKLCKNIYAKIKELPKDDHKRKDLISRFNAEKGKLESIKNKYTSLNSAISKLEK